MFQILHSVLLILLLVFTRTPFVFAADHSAWTNLLKQHVESGSVNYAAFQNESKHLQDYLNSLARLSKDQFSEETREEKLATWINLYNASVIAKILDFYPVDSIQQIPNFWDDPFVYLAGARYSLREIRDQIVRREFRDERAALALVSGTKSSTPLRSEAYEGNGLIEQLKDQMKLFLADERYNQIKAGQKKIKLAAVFKELANDFVLGYGSHEEGEFSPQEFAILSFIRVHVDDVKLREWIDARKYKIRYEAPDFSLNQSPEKKLK